MRYRVLALALAFCGGIAFSQRGGVQGEALIVGGAAVLVFIVGLACSHRPRILGSCLLAGFFLSGFARGLGATKENFIFAPQGLRTLRGEVVSFPERCRTRSGEPGLKFDLRLEKVNGLAVEGRVRAFLRGSHPLDWGDAIEARGQLSRGQKEIHRMGPEVTVSIAKPRDIERLGSRRRDVRFAFWRTRRAIEEQIDRFLPDPERTVVQALILGAQREIDPVSRDDFARCGTAHLLAISGGNVALLAGVFMLSLSALRVPKPMGRVLGLALLAAYCAVTGGASSVLRATIMACLLLLGQILERDPDLLVSLAWSAILILAWQPNQICDVGFQLSFACVFFMGVFSNEGPAEKKEESRWPSWLLSSRNWLAGSLKVSWACSLASVPLIASYFSQISPGSVFINLAAVPFFEAVVASSIAFCGVGILIPPLSPWLGHCVWALTHAFLKMNHFLAGLPFVSAAGVGFGGRALALYYGLWTVAAFREWLGLSPALERSVRWAALCVLVWSL